MPRTPSPYKQRRDALMQSVGDSASWEHGTGYEFECSALLGPIELSYLIELAAFAPQYIVDRFLEWNK